MTTATGAGGRSAYREPKAAAWSRSSWLKEAAPRGSATPGPSPPAPSLAAQASSATAAPPFRRHLGDAVLQAHRRGPPPAAGHGVVDDHGGHLARLGRHVVDPQRLAERLLDHVNEVQHGDRRTGADHHRPTEAGRAQGHHDGRHDVGHVDVVADLEAVTVYIEGALAGRHPHQPGHDAVLLRHAGAVDIGEAKGHAPHPVGGVVAGQQHFPRRLGGAVRASAGPAARTRAAPPRPPPRPPHWSRPARRRPPRYGGPVRAGPRSPGRCSRRCPGDPRSTAGPGSAPPGARWPPSPAPPRHRPRGVAEVAQHLGHGVVAGRVATERRRRPPVNRDHVGAGTAQGGDHVASYEPGAAGHDDALARHRPSAHRPSAHRPSALDDRRACSPSAPVGIAPNYTLGRTARPLGERQAGRADYRDRHAHPFGPRRRPGRHPGDQGPPVAPGRRRRHRPAPGPGLPRTLSFDIGGTGLKASVLSRHGELLHEPVRTPTPYPLAPNSSSPPWPAWPRGYRPTSGSRPASRG